MRYPREQKEQTHARLVQAASRRFRGRGGEGVTIGDLMGELKLTHGGFYRHFNSKEQLFAEAVARGFAETEARMISALAQAKPGSELKTLIERYLSLEHCAQPAEGCPAAALAGEMARHSRPVRLRFEAAIHAHASRLLKFLPGTSEEEKRRNALVLFSGMAGAMTMARAVADEKLRQNILDAAREFYVGAFCR
jgi:TetR/AcrR family transcriptional repressor of nem operon